MAGTGCVAHPLVTLENATMRVRDRFILPDTCWEIKTGQNWAVTGPNGSGKSSLVRTLTGHIPVIRGRIVYHGPLLDKDAIGYISFELLRGLIAREEAGDEARLFSNSEYKVTTSTGLINSLCGGRRHTRRDFDRVVEMFRIGELMDRPLRTLSFGEMKKVMISGAILGSPRVLILDEPFEGLDAVSSKELKDLLGDLMDQGIQLILVTHRVEDIVPGISHLILLKNCKVTAQGKREDLSRFQDPESFSSLKDPPSNRIKTLAPGETKSKSIENGVLVSMKDVNVEYRHSKILKNLDWTVRRGENWIIFGPNGCGKTSLLGLITGDNLQSYSNKILLFGKRKGSGESVWEIKQKISVVSSEFQINYRKAISVIDVVRSGFFDSIGLYRHCSDMQNETVEKWMELLCIGEKKDRMFSQLSMGEQRMVLLARAMVKAPVLMILDEPCQGLDTVNRKRILELIDIIGSKTSTGILYVTHHPGEFPSCITDILRFDPRPGGGYGVSSKAVL